MPDPYDDIRNYNKIGEYPYNYKNVTFHSIRDFISTEKNILKEYYNNYICNGVMHGNLSLNVILVKEDYNVCFLDYGVIVYLTESSLRKELILLLYLLRDLSNLDTEYYLGEFEDDVDIRTYVDDFLLKRSSNILDLFDFDKAVFTVYDNIKLGNIEDCINDYINRNGFDHLKCLDLSNVDITNSNTINCLENIITQFAYLQELYICNQKLNEKSLLVFVKSLPYLKYLYRFEFCTDNNILSDVAYSIEQFADSFIYLEYLKCVDLRSIFIIIIFSY